jgi:hypothetical protein
VEYNCALIKVDCLAACIALRVVGAVLVVFLRRWRKICTILQKMGSKGRYLKNVTNPALERLKNLKTGRDPLDLRPRTDRKPNPSRETATLNVLGFYQKAPPRPLIQHHNLELLCELAYSSERLTDVNVTVDLTKVIINNHHCTCLALMGITQSRRLVICTSMKSAKCNSCFSAGAAFITRMLHYNAIFDEKGAFIFLQKMC